MEDSLCKSTLPERRGGRRWEKEERKRASGTGFYVFL